MSQQNKTHKNIRILFSEGSSTNAREMINALGIAGYRVDLCDPNPACLGRFSRYVNHVYRCPVSGRDPMGYLNFIISLLTKQHYDVLFPANEQAYLFSRFIGRLAPLTDIAVADFDAFNRVQTKSAFMRLLDELAIPHPETKFAHTWNEIERSALSLTFPVYIKTSYGTASTGVWRVENPSELIEFQPRLDALSLLDGSTEFLVQAASAGYFEQSHAIFDRGRLAALRCTRRLLEGAQGGAVVKIGVDRPAVRRNFEALGRELHWHGSLSIDYFWDEALSSPSYIDCNPRITEPMNAMFNGVNLAELQVRLSLGETLPDVPDGSLSAKSHTLLQAMLGSAGRRLSRRDVLHEVSQVLRRQGIYADCREGMTPVREDFLSIIPVGVIFASLMVNPGLYKRVALNTISNYSLGAAIPLLAEMGE